MTTKILNLTQHVATPEQIKAGVFEPSAEDKLIIQNILTFDELPTREEISERARWLSEMAVHYCYPNGKAMIGGAPYLMSLLEDYLKHESVVPVYAFSKRESVDQVQPDESVRKVAVFRHCGFVEV